LFYATAINIIYTLSLHDALPIYNRTLNYLKNFSYTLSYSIVVAILCIFFVILSSFFTSLLNFHLSDVKIELVDIDLWLTLKVMLDRKSTRLNSSHVKISYAVFCL